jgi:hypothetical protein
MVAAVGMLSVGSVGVQALPTDVTITHAPVIPTTADQVTFVATAFDTAGIDRIRIFVDGVREAVCLDSLCILDFGPMAEGTHSYQARVVNGNGNITRSDIFQFDVVSPTPDPTPTPDPAPAVCGVDITGLDVSGDIIYYSIRNSGNQDESIDYSLKVNAGSAQTGSFTLAGGSSKSDQKAYNFGYDSYVITLQATADCGVADSQTITHTVFRPYSCNSPSGYEGDKRCDYSLGERLECRDGYWVRVSGFYDRCVYNYDYYGDECSSRYVNQYRCDGDVRQRLYRYSDCDTSWKDWEVCDYDCYRGYCVDYQGYYYDDYGQYHYYQDYKYDYRHDYYHYYDYDRCSAGWQCTDSNHKAYHYSDCSWGQSNYCTYGCESGACRTTYAYQPPPQPAPSPSPYPPSTHCSVEIENLKYSHEIGRGDQATVEFTTRNTGRYSQSVTYKLYVDSVLKSQETKTLNSGSTYFKDFEFDPGSVGRHDIKVVAKADCGFSDVRLASIEVVDESGFSGSGSSGSAVAIPGITSIDTRPSQLDILPYESKVFAIEIKSPVAQGFTIDIEGMEPDWLSYPSAVQVPKGIKNVYVYVTPQDDGVYPLHIKVRALSDGDDFSKVVRVYVSPIEGTASASGGTGGVAGGAADDRPITGLVVAGDTPVWFGILVIVAVVIAYLVFREYRKKKDGEQPEGFAIQDVDSGLY